MPDPGPHRPVTLPLAKTKPGQQTPLDPGRVVAGRYRVKVLVGLGGMGAVYEAEHLPTGRSLALKVLLHERGGVAGLAARFQREAKAQSLLDHPNIAEVLDLGALEEGPLFLAMELLRGISLADAIETGPLQPRRALVIARQVLDGLGHAHRNGMIHRDLKPENVMLVTEGDPGHEHEVVKICDFGLVKLVGETAAELGGGHDLSQTGVVFGTPEYMSPEQALGRTVDARADLYSLGIILFEMLAGQRPFGSADPLALLRMQVTTPPPALPDVAPGRSWCTPELAALVARALRKRREERFAGAEEMTAALDAAFLSLNHLPAAL